MRFSSRFHLACFLLVACHHRHDPGTNHRQGAQHPAAAALLGLWEYAAPSPVARRSPGLGAGLQVALEIDSAAGDTFSGHVARWFSGDMGMPVTAFARVSGRIDSSLVTLTIPFASPTAQPMEIRARLVAADTLEILAAPHEVGTEQGPFAEGPGARFVRTERGAATAKP